MRLGTRVVFLQWTPKTRQSERRFEARRGMMQKKQYTAAFKAEVAQEVLKETQTLSQLGCQHRFETGSPA